jgi:hypothetical protein
MSVTQTEEITKKKVFQADFLKYTLGETNRLKFKKMINSRDPYKVKELVTAQVQKTSKKFVETLITGVDWQVDCEAIADEVIKMIKTAQEE